MTVKRLTEYHLEFLSLKGGSSEFTLVKIPHCWKSHVVAHLCMHSLINLCFLSEKNIGHMATRRAPMEDSDLPVHLHRLICIFNGCICQLKPFAGLICMFCCFTSQLNSHGHGGTVSSPNHTFSWASLNKQFTSTSCTYFRL